jgi:hypothetical protein
MQYDNYQRNHVILPGREVALESFLNATLDGKKHKWQHARNPNSEDALTWSCFDVLRNLPREKMVTALDEIMEDAFGVRKISFDREKHIDIHIGKRYESVSLPQKESTELDASIELDDKLIFFEAKLYGSISLPDKNCPYDQIIKKMRIGLDIAHSMDEKTDFYFIFLDIAPIQQLLSLNGCYDVNNKFGKKWKNACHFSQYKEDPTLLQDKLLDVPYLTESGVAQNMGWLTWPCLFKTILRAIVS